MKGSTKSAQRLAKLIPMLEQAKNLLIVMQDYPDPDAVAAGAALRQLGNVFGNVPCTFTHGGGIGRAENRALVKYLGLNLHLLANLDLDRFDLIGMVDTQPGTGNNSFPTDRLPDIVIDHHPIRRVTRGVRLTDIRNRYGACATILFEYLRESGITLETQLATALLYGIRSDTQDLGREATQADVAAYVALYPLVNKRVLSRIEHATVPRTYYQVLSNALRSATMVGPGILCDLGAMPNPDMIAEVADLLLRAECSSSVLCYGQHEGALLLSLRTSDMDVMAGRVIRRLIGRRGSGGGHNSFAGGQVPLDGCDEAEIREIKAAIGRRFVAFVKAGRQDPERLVAETDVSGTSVPGLGQSS